MKSFLLLMFVSVLFMPVLLPAQHTEQEKKMMQVWSKLAVPGEHHKHISQFQGSWNVLLKFRMSPTGSMQESTGSCEKKLMLGGRYLSEHCTSRTKNSDKVSEGMGFLGYDN